MANGKFAKGDGSQDNPWIIADADGLNAIRDMPKTDCFELENNIDLGSTPYNSTGWIPIPEFAGQLNGNGHVIKNLNFNNPGSSTIGLFANLAGSVTDLGLVNADITGHEQVGAIAGRIQGGQATISRCFSTGNLKAKDRVGGLVGEVDQLHATEIINCHSAADITIETDFAGGLVGYVDSTSQKPKIINCFYHGKISGGNLITAGPVCGTEENIETQHCFYDKEKTRQRSVLALGLTTAESHIKENFEAWLYQYHIKKPVWKFLDDCTPKLWYQDCGRIMVLIQGKYYTYDTDAGDWSPVGETLPDRDTFWDKGMENLDNIPIAKLKELVQYRTVEIVNLIDRCVPGADPPIKIQLLFDVERTNKALTVQSYRENQLVAADDFNPVFRSLIVEHEQKSVSAYAKRSVMVHYADETGGERPFAGLFESNRSLHIDAAAEVPLAGVELEVTGQTENAVAQTSSKSVVVVADKQEVSGASQHNVLVHYADKAGAERPFAGLFESNRSLHIDAAAEVPLAGVELEVMGQTESAVDQTSSKSIVVVADKQEVSGASQHNVLVHYADKTGVERPFAGLFESNRSLHIDAAAEVPLTGVELAVTGQTEKPVSLKELSGGRPYMANARELLVASEAKTEYIPSESCVVYEIYTALNKADRAIRVNAKDEGKSRYLISVNNGGKWLTYHPDERGWVETELQAIADKGITIEQMADEAIWDSLPSDYRSKIKYAIGIRNESFNSSHNIKKLDIEFMPNKGPLVQDGQVQVLTGKVVVSGVLIDAENDAIEYQVVTKQFSEQEWRQITPEPSGWFKRKNGYVFTHEYELSQFRAGDNAVKIVTRDSRGITQEQEYQIILFTGEPKVTLNFHNEFYMNATIDHSLGNKVRFCILINGQPISSQAGYTDWKEAGFTFDFSWNSEDLLYGLPNEITIEAVDELGTKAETKFHVIGGYRSLLFRDEDNFYYSTDQGDILQQLDFGTVIGGLLTKPRVVFLENRTGLELENVVIWADNDSQHQHVKLYLSEMLDPFEPVETIELPKTMANGEVKPFYVRVESDIDVESIERKVFKIFAKGEPVVAE